jgi:hypothetical protein
MRVKYSPLYKHDVNGIIKRAGGVLITRAIVLKLNGRFPDNMLAGYFLN